ncbi:MAG: CBS domain-containing protein [Alphaproteobacteria bacterium]|jgi:CBS domain-containing protein|nr:CBS domain-containing protein [Alphaproteobacteria bacterium]MBT4017051.1 CBS domain-containing protein [Alphaproteobacteria bacterium]MBT5161474.1 CBS domain-containing protein [Alphaproteobacteria bacterium]MBT5919768.1 CBS domain-containing protein [Alphaproteobacteria bacterium]MBT6385964.1 CBS domain-containing protein [Alphaproteobacteria bacterium]
MDVGTAIRTRPSGVVTVNADDTIQVLASVLLEHHIGAVPVVDGRGGIVGMISERDLVRGLATKGGDIINMTVRNLMTADVVACNSSDPLSVIKEMMTEGRFRHMPVIEEGELVGVVTIRDVVEHLVEEPAG